MPNYNTIVLILDECIEHYKELLSFENEKIGYITSNNVSELSNSLSREQALIMKGNSLEAKRLAVLKKEGVGELRFSELIEQAPDGYSTLLNAKHSELSQYINEVKRINGFALDMVKEKLSYIENRISQNQTDTYDKSGEKKHKATSGSTIFKNV